MKTKLSDIAEIQFGTNAGTEKLGEIIYLQVRNFDANGILRNDEPFQFIHSVPNIEKALLKNGDILLASKGSRNTASVYNSEIGEAVASSTFFVLRVDQNKVSSQYLAFFLNLTKTQNYFFVNRGAGTTISSIKKQDLEELEIFIPPLHVQQKLIEIKSLWERERELTSALLQKKEIMYQSLFNKIISGETK